MKKLLLIIASLLMFACADLNESDIRGSWTCIGNTVDSECFLFSMISFKEDNKIELFFPTKTFFGTYTIKNNTIYCELDNAVEKCRMDIITYDKNYTNSYISDVSGRIYLKMYLDDVFFMDFDCVRVLF